MPSAPAGAAEAAADGVLGGAAAAAARRGRRRPPQTAEEAVATARAYAESISDGVIERDRAGNAPVAELARLDASGLLAITVPRSLGGPELGAPARHDPVAWKYHHVGNFMLNDVLPPNHGQL